MIAHRNYTLPFKVLTTALLLGLLLITISEAVAPTLGHAQGPEEEVLYEEDFDDGQARDWNLESEGAGEVGWVVEDSMLRGREHYWAVYEQGNWFNAHLALAVYLGNPYLEDMHYEGLHISVRLSSTGRYFVALHPNRVALFRQQGFGSGERFDTVGEHQRNYALGIPHGVSISVYEGHVLVVIDGVTEFDWVDPAPLPTGTIALETLDSGYARVDDVRVYGPPPAPTTWTLSGRVYDGEMGDERHPLQGITVEVYGANNLYPDPGVPIASSITNEQGWYGVEVPAGYEFYSVRAFAPPGVESAGATTVDGTVRANDWIEYVVPLEGKTLTGDKFWLRGPAREPEGPDLTILSADNWHFEDDGWALVLHLEIVNQGNDWADWTEVHVGDLDGGLPSSGSQVPDSDPGQVTSVDVRLEVPEEQRGMTHWFWVAVDPDEQIEELDEDNNVARTPGIFMPPLEVTPPPTETRPVLTPTPAREEPGLDAGLLILVLVVVVGLGGIAFAVNRGINRWRDQRKRDKKEQLAVIGIGGTYYYVGGKRVSLTRREDLIVVKLKGVDSRSVATRSVGAANVPDFQLPTPDDIWPGGEMVLQQSPGITRSAEEQASQLRSLNRRADIEYASPLYEYTPADRWIATNQIIAQFSESMSEFDIDALNDFYGVERIERIDWLPRAYLLQVTPAASLDALSIANTYFEKRHVVFAHPNFLRKYVHRNVGLQPTLGLEDKYWHLSAIEAFTAWQMTTGSPTIAVAIIDDGVDTDHVAFPNQATHFNVIDRSYNPRPPKSRARHYMHGTACAGLAIGAPNQAIGTSGVAPGCRLMAVRLLDRVVPASVQETLATELSGEDVLALARALSVVQPYREGNAIQWAAEHGAGVISNSWGPPDGRAKPHPIDDYARLALMYAVEKGRDGKGCVVCWAAGNGNESISYDGYASHPQVLAIAACTVEGKRAPYSDYGPELDISAPGGGYSDGLLTTVAVDPEGHTAYRHNFNGTSAAAPIVAGVAALLLSAYPDLTREEVYNILRATADKIDPQGGQYDASGHSPFYGWGRVNARRALEKAAQQRG